MNIWRNNSYDIHSQVKKIFIGLTLPISIAISNLLENVNSDFGKINSSYDNSFHSKECQG